MFSLKLFIPDFKNGGGERLAESLITELTKDGNSEIEVCSEQEPRRAQCKTDLVNNWRMGFGFRFCTKTASINLIYLTGPILLYGLLGRKGAVLYEHGNPFVLVALERRPLRKWLYARALRKCEVALVVNRFVREKFIEVFGLNPQKIVVIENPVSKITQHRAFTLSSEASFEKLDLAVIIGRFSAEKRIFEGIAWLQENVPNTRIVIISDFEDQHIGKNIQVYSNYDECPKIDLKNAALFNFSYVETFSLVIGEWLAAGGTVFSVNCGTLNSIWGHYRGFHLIDEAPQFCNRAANDRRPKFQPKSSASYASTIKELIHERFDVG